MAELILRSSRRLPETHRFVSTSASDSEPESRTGEAHPEAGQEPVWRDRRGERVCVRPVRPGANPLAAFRAAAKRAAESMRARRVARARFEFPPEADDIATALLPHLVLADYAFDRYRRRKSRTPLQIEVRFASARVDESDLKFAREAARAISWVRDLGNTPANDLGVAELTAEVRRVARRERLTFRALSPAQIRREKMGGVLAVASGSRRPPGFLVLEYRPASERARIVIVGKGITFDSGGISIKPAASMGEMKFDMLGAATALAIVRAARALRLPVRVTALTPIAENVPSGSSYRPGDILRMRNGKTVEIDNTDAEGRLILADALSYAETFSPDLLIDFATLTGAIVVALGQECAGLFSSDDRLAGELLAAGDATGDRFWRMPLWSQYRDLLRSDYADMKNTGGRWGGAVTAAVFLKEFVPAKIAWAHCDIAGTGHFEHARGGFPAGASGFGVLPVLEMLRRRYRRRPTRT
jgi:leucyl aminopeptidase